MRGIAESLTEQDIADLAAYYEQHGARPPPAADQRQPRARARRWPRCCNKGDCVSCHGADFNKPIDPSYPKLAGQHADYLFVALKAYKAENNPAGRPQQRRHGRAWPSSSPTPS